MAAVVGLRLLSATSGLRMGQSSSVGVPITVASTNERLAFGGLIGSMICATGGLGNGLSKFEGLVGLVDFVGLEMTG